MLKRMKEFLAPTEYRNRIREFSVAKKNSASYYMFNNSKYKVTDKQSTFCEIYNWAIYVICGVVAGLCGRIYFINGLISLFIRVFIGAACGLLVQFVSLRLFIKESNRNLIVESGESKTI